MVVHGGDHDFVYLYYMYCSRNSEKIVVSFRIVLVVVAESGCRQLWGVWGSFRPQQSEQIFILSAHLIASQRYPAQVRISTQNSASQPNRPFRPLRDKNRPGEAAMNLASL